MARRILVRLCPLWWVYMWSVNAFITHDCDRNPLRCRLEPVINTLGFLDVWQSE